MRAITLSALIAIAAASGCAKPGATLGYGLPSPPDAVYRIDETVEVYIAAPGGSWEVSGGYSLNLDMRFEMEPGGMRARGIVESFEGSLSDPIGDLGYLVGTIEFVANPGGVVEVESYPRLSGLPARELSLAGLPYDLFPRLPEDTASAGVTWADTVSWHTDQEEAELSYIANYTYTLVGDTVVDGRDLLHIAVAGEIELFTAWDEPGNLLVRRVKGPLTGFILWDPERGLAAHHEYEKDLVGTVTREDSSFKASLAGRVRIRLGR